MSTGICKLTGASGRFVKSHLIPRALTKPEAPGLPFFQAKSGSRPIMRWSSWYDAKIVTKEGEDILTSLDTWAINLFRKEKLIWRSWGPMQTLGDLHTQLTPDGYGFRKLKVSEPKRLRIFIMSLLWRAAVSLREEFEEIRVSTDDIERMRRMLVDDEPEPICFYPACLTQISTIGIVHNLAPLAQMKTIPPMMGQPEREIPIFRFYFDGLIIHIHNHSDDDGYTASLENVMVGEQDDVLVSTVPYEISFERENLFFVMAESQR